MVEAVPRIEISRVFTSGDAGFPLLDHEIRAAQQVVTFGVGGRATDLQFKSLNGLVRSTGGKEFLRRCGCVSEGGQHDKKKCRRQQLPPEPRMRNQPHGPAHAPAPSSSMPQGTTLTAAPSTRGLSSAGNATMS